MAVKIEAGQCLKSILFEVGTKIAGFNNETVVMKIVHQKKGI
jgi:hypothetical protein